MTKYSPILQHSEWRARPSFLSLRYFCYSRGQAVAKSGVHVSQREELWSSLSLYFKTDFEFERGGRDDKQGNRPKASIISSEKRS
ncbi:hypothetical protein L195_g022084 [Trifolium pratense]|uniref:Uncharacterized protein n=1 Tax=Trifolium pratense TaxID=57577 RepID=A0A2K3N730_TRIPR|nr:hypothetical protein L195_g022084 [Trifolium pratense]